MTGGERSAELLAARGVRRIGRAMEDSCVSTPIEPLTQQTRAPAALRVASWVVLGGVLFWLAFVGRAQIRLQGPDFEYFYKAGAWLLNNGSLDCGFDRVDGRRVDRGTLDWYWPVVSRGMTLLAWLPLKTAGYVWLALNVAALVATLRMLARLAPGPWREDWVVTAAVPLLLLTAYWQWEFRLNQINNFTLLLMVGSFVCWEQGRRNVAGFWLGFAVLLKVTPALLVVWFALKRQYRTVAVTVLTMVLVGPVGNLLSLGPELTIESYRAWLHNAVTVGSQAGLVRTQREMDWRNQGLGAVASRWLHPTNYNTHFDNDPRVQESYAEHDVRTLNVVSLPVPTVAAIVTGMVLATVVGLGWLARRPARQMTQWELRVEWALFVLAMLWLMPVMRRYHMIWALPALSLLLAAGTRLNWRRGWARAAAACVSVAVLAQLTLFWRPLEARGSILASVAVMALPMVLLLWKLRRRPDLLEAPAQTETGVVVREAPPAVVSEPVLKAAGEHA